MSIQTITVVLAGEARTGKTSYLRRLLSRGFEEEYAPTLRMNTYGFHRQTNCGFVEFIVHDTPAKYEDVYKIKAQAMMLFAAPDDLERLYIKSVVAQTLFNSCKVICESFEDLRTSNTYNVSINNILICSVSARDNVEIEAPLLYVMQKVMKRNDIVFTDRTPPNIIAPTISNNTALPAETVLTDELQAILPTEFRFVVGDRMIACTHRPSEIVSSDREKSFTVKF